jgi:hypothetical protein
MYFFGPGSGHMGFVVDKAALGHIFPEFPLPLVPIDYSTIIINHYPGMLQ